RHQRHDFSENRVFAPIRQPCTLACCHLAISVDGSRQRRAVGGPRRRRARTDAALGQASDIQGYRRMTTPADTVPKTIIKIFPETIGSFARNPADLPAPSAAPNAFTQLWKWLWLP